MHKVAATMREMVAAASVIVPVSRNVAPQPLIAATTRKRTHWQHSNTAHATVTTNTRPTYPGIAKHRQHKGTDETQRYTWGNEIASHGAACSEEQWWEKRTQEWEQNSSHTQHTTQQLKQGPAQQRGTVEQGQQPERKHIVEVTLCEQVLAI